MGNTARYAGYTYVGKTAKVNNRFFLRQGDMAKEIILLDNCSKLKQVKGYRGLTVCGHGQKAYCY